jgi:hypothetical protein
MHGLFFFFLTPTPPPLPFLLPIKFQVKDYRKDERFREERNV